MKIGSVKLRTAGAILGLSLVLIMVGGAAGAFYQQSVDQQLARNAAIAQLDADQKALYDASVKAQTQSQPIVNDTAAQAACTVNNGTFCATTNPWVAQLFIYVYYSPYYPNGTVSHGTAADQTLMKLGYIPDCLLQCFKGINYFKDPTTLIVDTGRCWEQDAVFSGTASACGVTFPAVGTAFAIYEGWSVDTHTPAHGDTYGGGATIPCSSSNLIVDGNGLRDVAMTVTLGGAGTTVSTSMTHSFSITGTYTAVQVSCVIIGSGTNADANANPQIYGEGTTGPFTFHSGDSLTGTWVVSRT